MTKSSYYAVIPADVRYDTKISSSSKLLYAEITALSNQTGKCFCSNSYFVDLYEVDERTIRRWLQELQDQGYIEVDNSGFKRLITARTKMSEGGTKMSDTPDKNVPHNNIVNNNKISIEERMEKFAEELEYYTETYSLEMLQDFYRYWTEPNKSKSKLKWEMEKTWDTSRRLTSWKKNSEKFGKKA